jgi:hypothetical protein
MLPAYHIIEIFIDEAARRHGEPQRSPAGGDCLPKPRSCLKHCAEAVLGLPLIGGAGRKNPWPKRILTADG